MEDAEAETVACKVEHVAGVTVLARLAEFAKFVAQCPEIALQWDRHGKLLCEPKVITESCLECGRAQTKKSE